MNLTLGTTAQSTTNNGYASGDTLINIENVIGSPHRDTLTAADGGSVITGGRNIDTLSGGSGNDTFVFAPGDGDDQIDNFTIAGGADKIDLSAHTSIASLDDLKGKISPRDSNTDIKIDLSDRDGITLNNVTGLDTNDEDFYGLTADNFIFYTKLISGNMGDRFNNEMKGGRGDDVMYGEQGRDIINGDAGDDEIYGGEDNDTINGGEGNDLLDGGLGIDTFVFEPGHGNDHIMDFTDVGNAAIDDRIDLTAFENITGISGLNQAREEGNTDNTVITLTDEDGETTTITLLGIGADLGADNFVFFGA